MSAGRVLVTGAGGFVGGALIRRLASEGVPVRGLVRSEAQGKTLAAEGIEIAKGDLRDQASLREAMEDVDVVYNIAALFRQEGVERQAFESINVTGVRNALDAAIGAGVTRFVHCSTIGVHGHIANPPGTEDTPFAPGDIYQRTKLKGEQIAAQYMAEERLPISIVRPASIYGPGDLRMLKLFRGIKLRRFPMIGDCEAFFHPVYIDDLVQGMMLCGTLDQAVGHTFIIAGSEYISLKDLMATVASKVGANPPWIKLPLAPVYWAAAACETVCNPLNLEPPLYRRRVDFFTKSRAFDISKARRKLGYTPAHSIPEGVERTASWYAEQGLL
ncbi:MAG: NAD-dependent epimerase/dehydratase family protein [Pseudomonadota bacterium]